MLCPLEPERHSQGGENTIGIFPGSVATIKIFLVRVVRASLKEWEVAFWFQSAPGLGTKRDLLIS